MAGHLRRTGPATTPRRSSRAPRAWTRRTCAAWPSTCGRTWARRSSSASSIGTPAAGGTSTSTTSASTPTSRTCRRGKTGRRPPTCTSTPACRRRRRPQVMTVPEGFQVKLFAGEPDVHAADRLLPGRPRPAVGGRGVQLSRSAARTSEGKDRIVIFEDTDGDGKFDKRTVFMEGLNLVSGLEVGFGGVWIGAAPYLLYVPIKEGEDKPAGQPQILLDGWGYEDTHETLNAFFWGPDGWLYGCHGVFTHSQRRQAGHARQGPHADQRRRLALSSDQARLRGLRPRHQQSVGPRFRRPRPGVHRGLRHPALPSTSSRAAATSGRRASTSTRTPTPTSRPSPTICTGRGPTRGRATTAPTSWAAATPTAA